MIYAFIVLYCFCLTVCITLLLRSLQLKSLITEILEKPATEAEIKPISLGQVSESKPLTFLTSRSALAGSVVEKWMGNEKDSGGETSLLAKLRASKFTYIISAFSSPLISFVGLFVGALVIMAYGNGVQLDLISFFIVLLFFLYLETTQIAKTQSLCLFLTKTTDKLTPVDFQVLEQLAPYLGVRRKQLICWASLFFILLLFQELLMEAVLYLIIVPLGSVVLYLFVDLGRLLHDQGRLVIVSVMLVLALSIPFYLFLYEKILKKTFSLTKQALSLSPPPLFLSTEQLHARKMDTMQKINPATRKHLRK